MNSAFIAKRLKKAALERRLSDVVDAVSDYNVACLPNSFVFVTMDMMVCFVIITTSHQSTAIGGGMSVSAAHAADLILLHDPLTNKQVVLKNREFAK